MTRGDGSFDWSKVDLDEGAQITYVPLLINHQTLKNLSR